jgi:shikimate kinase
VLADHDGYTRKLLVVMAAGRKRAGHARPRSDSLPMEERDHCSRLYTAHCPMNIILIGYRATGKTTLARLLAEKLGWTWVDADVEIEHRAGKSIARIFAEEGEPVFRDLEAEVIADLCGRDRLVLAAGGGAPLRPESRRAMRHSGQVVWLTAQPETIHSRMCGDTTTAARRPSLTEKGPLEEISHLLAVREPIYHESCHHAIETEGKTPDRLVDEILAMVQESAAPEGAP